MEVATGESSDLALQIDTGRFSGTYADTLFCHTCAGDEGWPARPFEVTSVGLREIEFLGRRLGVIDELVFQDPSGMRRIAFRENEAGAITQAFVPNRPFERMR